MASEVVVLVVLDDVHGGLLGGRSAPVDPDVRTDQLAVDIGMGPLVGGDQAARPDGADLVIAQQVVLVDVPAADPFVIEAGLVVRGAVRRVRIGDLLPNAVVDGLRLDLVPLVDRECALAERSVVRNDSGVQRIAHRTLIQCVAGVELIGDLNVSGVVETLRIHRSVAHDLTLLRTLGTRHSVGPFAGQAPSGLPTLGS